MKKMVLIICIVTLICSHLFANVSGNALQFDGIDDNLVISQNASLWLTTHLTIEMWIKPAELNRTQLLWNEPGCWWIIKVLDQGYIYFNFFESFISTSSLTNSNEWYHIACTYDSTQLKLYINGNPVGEHSYSYTYGGNNGPFYIGCFGENPYKGLIDEYRVWDVTRTQNQIQSTMNDTLCSAYYSEGSDSGLVAYWRFDETEGDSTFDLTSNHNDGFINGALFVPSDAMTEVEEYEQKIPVKPFLSQNYPNPFNPSTTIAYSIDKSSYVTLKIYDIHGREIKTLISEFQNQGIYHIHFDATQLASGIYFYQLMIGNDFVEVKKMLFIR